MDIRILIVSVIIIVAFLILGSDMKYSAVNKDFISKIVILMLIMEFLMFICYQRFALLDDELAIRILNLIEFSFQFLNATILSLCIVFLTIPDKRISNTEKKIKKIKVNGSASGTNISFIIKTSLVLL